jgi:pilus assembly protein Flp/PilA
MKNMIARLVREDAGQDLVEYAFLVGLIALVAYVGVTALGTKINAYYGTTINGATPFAS